MNLFIQVLSLTGAACAFGAYMMVQRGRWAPQGAWYTFVNIAAGAQLLVVALYERSLGFIALNLAWMCVSLPTAWGILKGNGDNE